MTHHVGMVELPEEGDLPNDVARDAPLGRCVGERDALDGHGLARVILCPAINDPVRPLPDHFRSIVVVFRCARVS